MNFAAGGGARPTPGKMDTNPNETYTITNGSHFKWKPHHCKRTNRHNRPPSVTPSALSQCSLHHLIKFV